MTVNLNLAGLPAVCLPCGFVEQPDGGRLPVGMQVSSTVWAAAPGACPFHCCHAALPCRTAMPCRHQDARACSHGVPL